MAEAISILTIELSWPFRLAHKVSDTVQKRGFISLSTCLLSAISSIVATGIRGLGCGRGSGTLSDNGLSALMPFMKLYVLGAATTIVAAMLQCRL